MLPSFYAALSRFYCLEPTHQFGNKHCIEPEYVNRNWLLHGMANKFVGKRDCIQLFNAIATFLGMITDFSDS